jgi:SAM-dependent methyltransferase
MPADWQLPAGVSRGLWEYVHDPAVARDYDAQLAGTPLLAYDIDFFFRHSPTPGRVIDLGCGTGRLAVAAAQRGHGVLAVDLSAEMLKIAGAKADRAGVCIDRLQANLVELDGIADASFDYAACLFSTLGMIADGDSRRRFLGHVRRILRPGGVFVVHVHNRWFHLATRAGRRLLIRNFWDAARGRGTAGDFLMPPHQGLGAMVMHLFTRREMMRLLHETGFQAVEMRPLTLGADGRMTAPWCLGRLRAYGYLIAARRPLTPDP